MVFDKLSNLMRYSGIYPALECVIDFLRTTNLSDLPSGRVDIDGETVYGNHFSYLTAPYSPCDLFESHQRHLDLHIILRGAEEVAIAPVESLDSIEVLEYEDSILYKGKPVYALPVEPGSFILLFPDEAHMPKLVHGTPTQVDKLVVKIAL